MEVDTGCVGHPWWDDKPVAVVGCGPSLAGFNYNRLRGPWHVLAVASAIWQLPWADALYDQDSTWLRVNEQRLRSSTLVGIELYLCWPPSQPRSECPNIPRAIWIEGQRGDCSFSERLDRVECGFTSGQGALNIAYLKRAHEIVLFGFDYAENGHKQHARDEDYPWHLPPGMLDRHWPQWARKFDATEKQLDERGIHVVNASPQSNITAFERCGVSEGVMRLQAAAMVG